MIATKIKNGKIIFAIYEYENCYLIHYKDEIKVDYITIEEFEMLYNSDAEFVLPKAVIPKEIINANFPKWWLD